MKLYLSGHEYRYAVEQSLLTLFPDQRPEYPDADPSADEDAAWSALQMPHQGEENIRASVSQMNMPEAEDFMREFAPSFMLPLDALN